MGLIDKAVSVKEMPKSNLWVLWGKSGSGKTHVLSTFPKPILYLQYGDDGTGTIEDVDGIDVIVIEDQKHLEGLLEEARLDEQYATVAVDTFSLFVNEWLDENAIRKGKRVTQQMWGDLKTDTEKLIKMAKVLSRYKNVVLTCHEATDVIEGMEDEIMPDVRPSVSKGARTYLESMANFGIHTTVIEKEVTKSDGTSDVVIRHAAHIAPNPYYWTKLQKPAAVKVPKLVVNPTYDKIMKLMRGEK